MNRSLKEIKRLARENLTDRYKIPMQAMLICLVIPSLIELPFSMLENNSYSTTTMQTVIFYVVEILIAILSSVLEVGQQKVHLQMARNENYSPIDVFYCFRNNSDHNFIVIILRFVANRIANAPIIAAYLIFMYVWTEFSVSQLPVYAALLIAGGILSVLTDLIFAPMYYLLLEHEELSVGQIFRNSITLMKGHKGRYFALMLSFLGYEALCVLTLGVGELWVTPYRQQAYALFYLDLIGEVPNPEHPNYEGDPANLKNTANY